MNKKDIENRIVALKKDQEHHRGMLHMLEGALQDCDYWLKSLDKENAPSKAPNPENGLAPKEDEK